MLGGGENKISRELVVRMARLICLTDVFAPLWESATNTPWDRNSGLRLAESRRGAEIELDALVAIGWGLSIDELCIIYRTQFPVLLGYERNDLYDANGRKVPGEISRLYRKGGENLTVEERTWTHSQSGVDYVFEFPFRSFDREEDMRKAYAHFSSILEAKS